MPINGIPSMKLPEDFEELFKGIKWNRYIPPLIGILQPVFIFGAWLIFARMDKRADAVSKIIAIAEPIPTIDLNLPRPVVLASLYHAVDEAMDILADVIEFMKDLEVPSAEEIIDTAKEEITEPVKEKTVEIVEDILPEDEAFKTALANCVMNAKKNLKYGTYYVVGPAWIVSCMLQKGYTVSKKTIEDKYF